MDFFRYEKKVGVILTSCNASRLTADMARDAFEDLLAQTKTGDAILLDLGAVAFMDSTGIGELVRFSKKLQRLVH